VAVVGAPCDPRWRSPAGLAIVGPRYFGYSFDFEPVVPGPGTTSASADLA
jgi:DUF917 family protein